MAIKAGVPIKIAGIKITPKWDWTPAYRKSYGKMLRGEHQEGGLLDRFSAEEKLADRLNVMADKYYKWLDAKRAAEHRRKGRKT